MANIAQQIPNFLGGVSTQPDDQKQINQVRNIVNGYLDPTFGLVKRNGLKWAANLGAGTTSSLVNGYWFYFRADTERFVACIANQTIRVWNVDGTECTVSYNNSNTWTNSYLTSYSDSFHHTNVVQNNTDQVVIVNRNITVNTTGVSNTPGSSFSSANSIADLPAASANNGAYYKIENISASSDDDYYVVSNGTVWSESARPGIRSGFNGSSAPHKLVKGTGNTFTFQECSWGTRTVGDLDSNPDPSFVGQKIRAVFTAGNRLGFVAGENVILSQPNKFFEFYGRSAQVLTDSDPVDLACGGNRKILLSHAVPLTQGVLLFSPQQQFLLFSDTGVFTPSTSTVKSLSNYEVDDIIPPMETGTNVIFINKTADYCRTIEMTTRGQGDSPLFVEVGKTVTQYVPSSVTKSTSNAQNGLTFMYDQSSSKIYIYRNYIEGQDVILRGWFSWQMPGNVQLLDTDNDLLYAVIASDDQLVLCTSELNAIPTGTQVADGSILESNPSFDFISQPKAVTGVPSGKEYVNGETRIYIPFSPIASAEPIAVQDAAVGSTFSGFYQACTNGTDPTKGNYFAIPGTDLTDLAWLVGYKLNMDIELPTIYFRNQNFVDVEAYLSIHRVNFALGLSGQCDFKITPLNQTEVNYEATTIFSNQYKYDKIPLDDRIVFTVPIMQKNTGYDLRVTSSNPYIVSLSSAMWEGNYSPRYYRRS